VPELLVLNKMDAATAEQLTTLRSTYRDAAVISARTGWGIDQLRAMTEVRLPRPAVEIRVLLPYQRGDLLDRIHRTGELLVNEHTSEGTVVLARVNAALAAELAPYEVIAVESTKS
jgi:GTP-binding protein HflX